MSPDSDIHVTAAHIKAPHLLTLATPPHTMATPTYSAIPHKTSGMVLLHILFQRLDGTDKCLHPIHLSPGRRGGGGRVEIMATYEGGDHMREEVMTMYEGDNDYMREVVI